METRWPVILIGMATNRIQVKGALMLSIDLTNKRALVTGANSGIGAAVAEKLAEAGADVAVNYLVGPDEAETVAEAIGGRGRKAHIVQADISSEADVSRMFDEVIANWGGIDILVNNAGIDGGRALGWDADPEAWRRVIDINLFGTFLMSRAALKHMIPRGAAASSSTCPPFTK